MLALIAQREVGAAGKVHDKCLGHAFRVHRFNAYRKQL